MEVRFDSEFDEAAVFGIIYNQIKGKFDKVTALPIQEIPASIRKVDPNLQFLPYFKATSSHQKDTLIQIGPKMFSVVITGEYPGWPVFYERINYGLTELRNSGVVSKINRMSLRYINFFEENILSKSNLSILLSGEALNTNAATMRFEIPDGKFLNVLSINTAVAKNSPKGLIAGSIIDIDTILNEGLGEFFNSQDKLLSDCHATEKRLFSALMSEEYTKSLKQIDYV